MNTTLIYTIPYTFGCGWAIYKLWRLWKYDETTPQGLKVCLSFLCTAIILITLSILTAWWLPDPQSWSAIIITIFATGLISGALGVWLTLAYIRGPRE